MEGILCAWLMKMRNRLYCASQFSPLHSWTAWAHLEVHSPSRPWASPEICSHGATARYKIVSIQRDWVSRPLISVTDALEMSCTANPKKNTAGKHKTHRVLDFSSAKFICQAHSAQQRGLGGPYLWMCALLLGICYSTILSSNGMYFKYSWTVHLTL